MPEDAAEKTERKARIAVIGAGFISQVAHLDALLHLPNAEIAGLVDSRADFCGRVARRFGIQASYVDMGAVLADPSIDGVVAAMPRRTTSAIVEKVLIAGKPVLSEKPMAYTLKQGRSLVSIAARNSVPYAVGFMKRYDAGVLAFRDRLRDVMNAGTYGAILHARLEDFCGAYAVAIPPHLRSSVSRPVREEEWPRTPDFLDDELGDEYEYALNVTSHDVNLLRFLFGDKLAPAGLRVRCGTVQQTRLAADTFDIAIDVGRGVFGRWHQNLEIFFERGTLRLELPSPLDRQNVAKTFVTSANSVSAVAPPPGKRVWAFHTQMQAFVASVRTGAPMPTSGADSLNDLAIIEELWKSVIVV